MQSSQAINWWLEISKIVIPVAATIFVGWWINRSNEKYKTELAKQIHRFQNLQPKRIAGLENFLQKVRAIEKDLNLAVRIAANELGTYIEEEHLLSELSPVAQRISRAVDELKSYFDDNRIFMNQDICERAEELTKNLGLASSSFITHIDEQTDTSWIPAKDSKEQLDKTKEIVQITIPKLKQDFEEISRTIIFD